MAYSSAKPKTRNSDISEFKSEDNQNQFNLHRNQNLEEDVFSQLIDLTNHAFSIPRASARGPPPAHS